MNQNSARSHNIVEVLMKHDSKVEGMWIQTEEVCGMECVVYWTVISYPDEKELGMLMLDDVEDGKVGWNFEEVLYHKIWEYWHGVLKSTRKVYCPPWPSLVTK